MTVTAAVVLTLHLLSAVLGSRPPVPDWEPTYDMQMSTILMPCNNSGFFDPAVGAKYGVIDFDWSNAKAVWDKQHPMDCEERLVEQAKMVKAINPKTKVFVYRNLVKALPWYTGVRTKITDPAYDGFFLKFKPGGAYGNGTYHVPQCTDSVEGHATKCSKFYHDQEQTPQPDCQTAAEAATKTNSNIQFYTWWAPSECWLSSQWHGKGESGHVTGYKGSAPAPSMAPNYNDCTGDCDCGEGLPCGEYLWDHRNGSMLRDYLVNDFVLNNNTGLGSTYVDGFYFDDGWTDTPAKTPPWAPSSYKQCNMWNTGGATEEDYYCVVDMGLSQSDVTQIKTEHDTTMQAVYDGVVNGGGFVWQLWQSRSASLDLSDPRPAPKCMNYMRRMCDRSAAEYDATPLVYEYTRNTFHNPYPLPLVTQDVAQFLLIRGKYSYIGNGWIGCSVTYNGSMYWRPKEVEVDYGVPVDARCSETAPNSGIFVREWTKAHVEMNCNDYTAKLDMK